MKNIPLLLLPALLVALLSNACKDKCDAGDFGITSLQPAANPVGYEIFIQAKGVTADTRVRFDEVDAASVKTAEGGLIVKVPNGISGPVSLSIEEGSCSDARSFEVLGTYPGNVPAGPTTIIVPQAPGSLPSSIGNFYTNLFDSDHAFVLGDPDSGTGTQVGSFSTESHFSNDFFNGNPISGTMDLANNNIFLIVDRTAQTGGFKDTLTGKYIQKLPLSPNGTINILLTSKRTGRQLVLYRFL